jgi:hypothetical protein
MKRRRSRARRSPGDGHNRHPLAPARGALEGSREPRVVVKLRRFLCQNDFASDARIRAKNLPCWFMAMSGYLHLAIGIIVFSRPRGRGWGPWPSKAIPTAPAGARAPSAGRATPAACAVTAENPHSRELSSTDRGTRGRPPTPRGRAARRLLIRARYPRGPPRQGAATSIARAAPRARGPARPASPRSIPGRRCRVALVS